jgi:hypothetical protein
MYVDIAFAFTPAAIIRLANVCLHSCNVNPSRPAWLHAVAARPTQRGSGARGDL